MAPPKLPLLDLNSLPTFTTPTKRINEGHDVTRFLTSLAYRDIVTFILQLNHSLIPRTNPSSSVPTTFSLTSTPPSTPSIQALQALLKSIESYIDEAPPETGPRRFGNVSFRKWYVLLEARLGGLLDEGLLGQTLNIGAKDEVSSYLLGAFGSSQRLDYGTGHELSFIAFLACLWKLGLFKDGLQDDEIDRQIVISVIEPYLRVVRKLILTYTLEPAGSHGVWGLDDHAFLPYIFGSAQLTRPILPTDPTPLEGSVRGAPRPSEITKVQAVEDYRSTNMYFSAIGFINDVKKGPFWEHSPILFDISGIKDGWGKINKGMIKMFNAEVLSKFPVVQHFSFGSLFSWEQDPEATEVVQSVHMANQPMASAAAHPSATGISPSQSMRMPAPPMVGTAAPWAQGMRIPNPPPPASGTAAPWAQTTRMPAPPTGGIPLRVPPPPGSDHGSLTTSTPTSPATGRESASARITVTKALWAK